VGEKDVVRRAKRLGRVAVPRSVLAVFVAEMSDAPRLVVVIQ